MSNDLQNIVGQVDKFKRSKTLSNGDELTIKLLPASKGITVAKKLLGVVAPAIGGTLDGLRQDDTFGTPTSFTNLAITLCERIDNAQIENLIAVLIEGAMINKEPLNFDEYFTANYGALIEFLEFALKENFSSFFMGQGIKARFLKTIQTLTSGMDQMLEE